MTLTNAIRTANSALASHSQHISNISRNISGIGDPTYVRRESEVYTGLFGTTRIETQRFVNQAVYGAMIGAQADAARTEVIANGLNRLASFQGENSFAFSPAKLLGDLQQMTEFAAAFPSDDAAMVSLIEQARTIAGSLNSSYNEVLSMKENADKEISQSVEKVNSLLAQIKEVNDQIVNGTLGGRDVFDSMDVRDQLIDQLSEEIGIKVISAENNDVIITTTSGAMMFEGKPREVSFLPIASYGPNTTGGELVIDGVTVSGPTATLKIGSGRIAGNLELRDEILVAQQNQLDELARGLVTMFAEEDSTGVGKPPLAGLFTWDGGPGIPASATLERGIASSIVLNPLADPTVGGNPDLIRDGALNGDLDYLYNTDGNAAFSDCLYELLGAFDETITFDTSAELPASQSLNGFANASVDFLNAKRATANNDYAYRSELGVQFQQSLQGQSGPNLDFEMSRLLEVERAYQATARLLATVDEMLATLIEAAG